MVEDARELVVQLNLYILQVISQLAKNDIADAMLRFGINREVAESLANLNPASLYEVARRPTFLFSVNQKSILGALKDREQGHGFRSMEDSISRVASLLKAGGNDDA